jgi:PPOX class probable F420-dependent enzyme
MADSDPAILARPASAVAPIPPEFADLADCPPIAALTTVMPDGSPQTSVVWCDREGPYVRINTMRGFRKEKNMRANPKVTLLCYDPVQTLRYLEVRGTVVEMTEEGALEHLDGLSLRYTGAAPYFGRCIPERFRETETPVLCRIAPTRVVSLDWPPEPGTGGAESHPGQRPEPAAPSAPTAPTTPALAGTEPWLWPASEPSEPIPASHRDLLIRSVHGVLTTMGPDGQPQSSLVWVDFDGECALVNTTRERRKGRNLAANPRVSLLVVDPANAGRFVQIRGLAECREEGAIEHLDRLTRKYTPHPRYYGYVYPLEQRACETRIVVRIRAARVTLDAIHS